MEVSLPQNNILSDINKSKGKFTNFELRIIWKRGNKLWVKSRPEGENEFIWKCNRRSVNSQGGKMEENFTQRLCKRVKKRNDFRS
jgi:hypothetical protein